MGNVLDNIKIKVLLLVTSQPLLDFNINYVSDGYGSLDRSFVRRARGSGGRTRQSLLASESDRERPASPSSLLTSSNLAASASAGLGAPQPPDHNRPR